MGELGWAMAGIGELWGWGCGWGMAGLDGLLLGYGLAMGEQGWVMTIMGELWLGYIGGL